MIRFSYFASLQDLFLVPSHQIRKLYGGKTLGLYEAHKLGLPIPPTWVIGYETLVSHKDLTFLESDINLLPEGSYAVRSSSRHEDSAEQSYAGIFESKLFVPKADIHKAIMEVQQSAKSERAKSYHGNEEEPLMSIILQPMVQGIGAGVAFSKHPSPTHLLENHCMVVEYAPTIGEKIVQGAVTPFRFVGTPSELLLVTDSPWMSTLVNALNELKFFYGRDIDVEFAVNSQCEFVLLQQRPISQLGKSDRLRLKDYERKYKRALSSLDIELLIEGCAKYLAPYLEVPVDLSHWMIMTSGKAGIQELHVHKKLDRLVVLHLADHIGQDKNFLELLEDRYQATLERIQTTNYSQFFGQGIPLEKRFFAWCEFFTPLTAHYYAPMFVIEALYQLLAKEFFKIDPQDSEGELFFLGTYEVVSLMEILEEKLYDLKKTLKMIPEGFEKLPEDTKITLEKLSKEYGFIKCHEAYEEPYTAFELFSLMKESNERTKGSQERWHELREKYVKDGRVAQLLEKFRKWLSIRNQEMEYLMFAMASSRPLFEEISQLLNLSHKEIWNSSRYRLQKAILEKAPHFAKGLEHDSLVIYFDEGFVHLRSDLTYIDEKDHKAIDLNGKKVFGQGLTQAKVFVAYSLTDLEEFSETGEKPILVTGMTTPDFVPYLKKYFCGLITDEGGILCHAAIIARENRIPCLVGTSLATEKLQTGMEILLDLDREMIQIIRCDSK